MNLDARLVVVMLAAHIFLIGCEKKTASTEVSGAPRAVGEPSPVLGTEIIPGGPAVSEMSPQVSSEPLTNNIPPMDSGTSSPAIPQTSGEALTESASGKVAAMAGILENQRPQTLDIASIGQSLKDPAPLANDPNFLDVNFNQLASFKYDIPDSFMLLKEGDPEPTNKPVIPESIRGLSGKKVAVTGFMLPLKVENGLVTELLLMRDQSMCCFGTVPEINEWISVKADKEGFKPINDQAVTFFGELRVDEIRENGYLVGIYEMDGYRMVGPNNLKEF
ncbi:MAG: DUF3299 domain-containing protein [Verrucomicrobia bacterium]|nr:DUF3299 domain-containing protein [Verrucomicrobiota bacterium]